MPQHPDVQRQQERFTDNLLQSSFSYWSAILTVNGLIFAFFSADILRENYELDWLMIIILFLCLMSISLILMNFRSVRDLYYSLGATTSEQIKKMSEKEREDYKNKDINKHKWKNIRETTIESLLLVEGILIMFIVIYSKICIS